jgi:hypothetical protein
MVRVKLQLQRSVAPWHACSVAVVQVEMFRLVLLLLQELLQQELMHLLHG